MSDFQPLEVVNRGSETQPQVVENLNKFTFQNMSSVMTMITSCIRVHHSRTIFFLVTNISIDFVFV